MCQNLSHLLYISLSVSVKQTQNCYITSAMCVLFLRQIHFNCLQYPFLGKVLSWQASYTCCTSWFPIVLKNKHSFYRKNALLGNIMQMAAWGWFGCENGSLCSKDHQSHCLSGRGDQPPSYLRSLSLPRAFKVPAYH